MESGRKKRKMGDKNDDDEEEKEVEKFFALLRSTREMRDRLRKVPNIGSKEEEDKKKQEEKSVSAIWNPTFQLEDFMDGSNSKSKNPLVVNDAEGPSSKIEKEKEKEKEKEAKEGGEDSGLDLKLSL
ncbi:hypothetical protein PTKIN_Ptkin01aG0303100 [Pterospermum kingtungense]